MANNKSSGKDLVKVVIIVIALVVLVACSFFSIINGIVEIFKQKAQEAIGAIAGAAHKGLQWLGTAKVSKGLPTFIVDKAQVEALKTNLESQAIDTDVAGMTEIRLSKMLLAYAVSSSFSDTVCAVEITEEDMINNYKEKNKDDTSVTIDTVLAKYGNMKSSSKWNISSINYTLYNTDNTSKVFFYFKDEDKVFGDNEEAWFLGAMGATTISTADGGNLNYIGESDFTEIKENFDAAKIGDKLNSEAYKQMLSSYTKTDSDTIKMYTVDVQQKEYYFCFENNLSGKIEEPEQTGEKFEYDVDADSTYAIGTQEINLTESIDLSKYSIPIELMMDLLNITGSGEFLETFIDYALSQISASVTAYSLSTESKTYEQKKYNVDSNFVIELYDIDAINIIEEVAEGYVINNNLYTIPFDSNSIIATGVYGDNFLAYYDIIYNRKYNGMNIPNNRVTSIENYENIRYKDGEEYNYENPNKDECKADSLEKYLKTAYEPVDSLEEINVTEVTCKTSSQNKWQLMVSSINTWYGDFSYILTEPETLYTTPEEFDSATKENYENYNHTKMKDFKDENDEEKEIIYIWEDLLKQVDIINLDESKKPNKQKGNDIYDDAMKTGNGQDNREHFQNWTMRGLATIAQNDGGKKNETLGVGEGTDYIYCKYKKTNVKKANPVIKTARQVINENNIQMTSSNDDIDAKMEHFLALLRNADGKIPNPLNSGIFTARDADPSIVVRYADIYGGTIPAGDLLLDNGALMLFELLETSENTQGLVNVFKYLAYLYTGTDYGITTATELATLFNTYQYSGTNYIVHTTLSDKDIVLDENKLKEAISKTYKGQAQTNLLNCIKQFMDIQENKNVNAVFAIAVTTIESSNGTNWDDIDPSTYNWFSIKEDYKGQSDDKWKNYSDFGTAVKGFGDLINGSNFFKAGKTTVNDIGPIYCNEQWAEDVNLEMTKIYNSIGIYSNTGGIEGKQGDITTFTVGNRTYKNYKQIIGSYKKIQLAGYPTCNLYSSGCAITSDAIIASGFNSNDTPVDVNNYAKTTSNPLDHPSIVKHYTGKKATWIYKGDLKTGVINQLRNGLPVMVHASSGKFAVNGSHFFVILSVSEDGTKVYVSNPSSYNDGISTGWLNASDLNTIDRYLKME